MSTGRRLATAGLLAFLAFVVVHAVIPWTSTLPLAIPPGVAPQSAVFSCGALWGPGYVHAPARMPYPAVGTPCSGRGTYRAMSGLDVLLAGAGLAVVMRWGRSRAAGEAS